MKEHVGVCHMCNKDIYCLDGFLIGITDNEGRLVCLECSHIDKGNLNDP
jgi:hypothetical protein